MSRRTMHLILHLVHSQRVKHHMVGVVLTLWILSLFIVYKLSSCVCSNTTQERLKSAYNSNISFESKFHIEPGFSLMVCIQKRNVDCQNASKILRYITIDWNPGSRIGNCLFGLSAMLGVGMKYNMAAILPRTMVRHIMDTFDFDPSIFKVAQIKIPRFDRIVAEEEFDENYIEKLLRESEDNIILHGSSLKGNFHKRRFFANIEIDLQKGLLFKKEWADKAESTLNRAQLGKPQWPFLTESVRVGIHVRRGDYMTLSRMLQGIIAPDKYYFKRAMNYFRSKFQNVQFVICSEDTLWVQENLSDETKIISLDTRGAVDLAVLAQCDHVIMSIGSYGWWGGWFSRGIVVYPVSSVGERDAEDMPVGSVGL